MFAIAGGKGGCGKTTTALGLARGLVTLGANPLVVDADLDMPDLHHRAGVAHAAAVTAIAAGEQPTAVATSSPRFPNVDVLSCRESDTATAVSAFERLRRCHRPVLLDCPAGASPAAAAPLRTADRTVLVSTPDEQSLQDTAKTAAMARQLDAPPALLVLVRSDGRVDPSTLFDCRQVVHVPKLPSPPLQTEESAARYLSGAKLLHKRNT
ncbi:MinD/ParA family ATP-binding protein [Haloarcula amylovorans]|uniref:MinD/ParA family ATP-binding protein n=1 Tax=Haloarcula amylovorans TaxID=2562280 RepID=UPI001076BC1F|nr:division plane positioning ATPase MipZ [Halomicroarcula amylolytica]